MKKVIPFLVVIIFITGASAVFADTLLTDNFNVTGGTTSDLNAELATRQTGTLAPTTLSTSEHSLVTIDSTGILKHSGGASTTTYNRDFANWSTVGNVTHYSFRMNAIGSWTTAYISALGNSFYNGAPGLAIEVSRVDGGVYYVDSFTEAHGWKGLAEQPISDGWHKWDVTVTQQAGYKEVVVSLDNSVVYTTTCPDDGWWTGGAISFSSTDESGFDDIVIDGTPLVAIPDAIGYVASGNKNRGINIYQTNGGYVRAFLGTGGEVMGTSFAPNGDLYFSQNYWYGIYKAAYRGDGSWDDPTLYATLPSGPSSYYGAFNLVAKDDGTVFVGTYASDEIYRIDSGRPPTVTKIIGAGLSGQLGWRDMELSPPGVNGTLWVSRQNTGLKNYNADGTDAGFILASVYDYIRGSAFAHGKFYSMGVNDYTTWFEYDPANAGSGTPYIVFKDFNSINYVTNYNLGAAFGADYDGDGYEDFYFKMWQHDGRGSDYVERYNIEVYSGAPDLTPTTRYLGSIENGSMYAMSLDTFPKGSQAPIVYNYAKVNYSDDITLDGDLSDWSDATFTAMDKAYYPDPSVSLDMSNAAYSLKWGAGGTKVYLALKVQDTDPIRNDWYTSWNANDHVEAQLWASSTLSGENDQNICNIFQQYEFGLQANGIDKWSYMCGSGNVPDFANFTYSVKEVIDGWVYYEAAMTPFETFSRLDINAVIARVLVVDDVVGADAVIASKNNFANFNMLAGDKVGGKSAYTASIKKRQLIREGVMGSVDLQNYDVSKLGIAGTATITDGTNTEIHNIVLDAAGLYSFTTALRGECTVVVKCSHWLGKAASVIVPSTGNVVVDLLSVINGDVVESNEVDFDDINATRAAYGSFPGDENWDARADVDGTGEVDFTDINIVRSKYGEIGD